jgi:hypothetical protein
MTRRDGTSDDCGLRVAPAEAPHAWSASFK